MIQTFLENISIKDIIDIFIVAFLLYLIFLGFKKTKSIFVLAGIIITGSLYLVANILGLRLLFVNPGMAQMLGYQPEEMIGKPLFDFMEEEEANTALEHMNKRRRGITEQHEFTLKKNNGEPIYVLVNTSPQYNKEGICIGSLAGISDITQRKHDEIKLNRAMDATIRTISKMIDARDSYTSGHQGRVTRLALCIAQGLGLSKDQTSAIRIAALIHDIGKISIPSEILAKPSALSDIEYALIKGHPQIGFDILKDIDFPYPIADIILQHHERINGSGYPNGLKNKEILLEAKVISVADVVEAMSSHRPYRAALGIDAALEEIGKNRGILYDPEVVDVCLNLFQEKGFEFNPAGTPRL